MGNYLNKLRYIFVWTILSTTMATTDAGLIWSWNPLLPAKEQALPSKQCFKGWFVFSLSLKSSNKPNNILKKKMQRIDICQFL